MGLNIGAKVDKVFENVGPGSLSIAFTATRAPIGDVDALS